MSGLAKIRCIQIAITLGMAICIFQQLYLVYTAYQTNISLKGPIGLIMSGLITLYSYVIYIVWKFNTKNIK